MRTRIRLAMLGLVGLATLAGAPAHAQTFNSGSTGADGPFNPTANVTVTLPPNGVFNYTTVDIPAGVTVTFVRNTANTPVTLLATGNVTIAGTIDVSGSAGSVGVAATALAPSAGAGGPGGSDGGNGTNGIIGNVGGAGLGPGGGLGGGPDGPCGVGGGGGGFASAGATGGAGSGAAVAGGSVYGAQQLQPLIGGSGGGAGGIAGFGNTSAGGGGGGGALMIASSGTITLTGTLRAAGGKGGDSVSPTTFAIGAGGGGSGGAIRLVATTITGSGGTINVSGGVRGEALGGSCFQRSGGAGSSGRVRVEAYNNLLSFTLAPPASGQTQTSPSVAAPSSVTLANAPTLRITAVAGVAAPATPTASFASPDISLPAGTTNPVSVSLAAANIPVGTTVTVAVKGQVGAVSSAAATLSGTLASSTASASVAIPTNEPSVISASASFTLLAADGRGPVYVQGEEVERVRVSANFGGPTQVAYITKSGREIVVTPGR